MAGILDERSKNDFLVYANSVIKSRAIPSVEDNLKPIHRKILYTLWEDKVTPDKPTKKCATEAGRVLAYSPHGDASVYGAMVRMSQWWKLRYPLIEMQGNCGNLLGDGAAASRYTECRLSPVGMLLLEDLNKNCVEFKPNYDETTVEPVTLPSKFPYLLCGNNSGIAVGMSSDLVSHNFTEVAEAIKYYLHHKDCSVLDLMNYIKGPDFPTGGQIINGEELYNIYTTGHGSLKMRAHYDVLKQGHKTLLVFHDIPYGVEIDSGVKAPLKKLVIEDGYDVFEDIDIKKAGPRNFDITITLAKDANVSECLNILFQKTRLGETIKVNQTVIVNGEPKVLNLKQLIQHYVDYRSGIIQRIAQTDYEKTNHKLTVTIGLQKCMSDIDLLIDLIRNSDSRADAKIKLIQAFELNEEQADAVLDMKLSRLSKLDLSELSDDEVNYRNQVAALHAVMTDESKRYAIIEQDLIDMKKIIGKDERLTEIIHSRPMEGMEEITPLIKKEWLVYADGIVGVDEIVAMSGKKGISPNLAAVVMTYTKDDIVAFNAAGELVPAGKITKDCIPLIGGFGLDSKKTKLVAVTANGNIKVSAKSEYKFTKVEKVMKLKDDDKLIYAALCDDNDFVMLYDGEQHVIKLSVAELPVASKLTVGVKSGFKSCAAAAVVSDSDRLLFCTEDNKGKFTSVKDFNLDSRGNKGQLLAEGTKFMRSFSAGREDIYIIMKQGAPLAINHSKLSIKSRTAVGASVTNRQMINII